MSSMRWHHGVERQINWAKIFIANYRRLRYPEACQLEGLVLKVMNSELAVDWNGPGGGPSPDWVHRKRDPSSDQCKPSISESYWHFELNNFLKSYLLWAHQRPILICTLWTRRKRNRPDRTQSATNRSNLPNICPGSWVTWSHPVGTT
jgi:hypothetical protein